MDFLTHLKSFMNEDEANKLYDSLLEREIHCLRVNDLKVENINDLIEKSRGLEGHPHINNAFIYDKSTFEAGKSILFDAGAYYIQEPAAMMAEYLLDIKENDYVLDMCAAPGGKSFDALVTMKDKGLLVCNDIHEIRSKILSSNIEKYGFKNVIVLNDDSKKYKKHFINFFDKIILDAPCSGSAMFRKNDEARNQWSIEKVYECKAIQQSLIEDAYEMLNDNGYLLYSTCSFSIQENEEVIIDFLNKHQDMELINIKLNELYNNSIGISGGLRLYPYKFNGEGQTIFILHKKESSSYSNKIKEMKSCRLTKAASDFLSSINFKYNKEDIILFKNHYYLASFKKVSLDNIKINRYGLDLGEMVKDRFEPSHALAMYHDIDKSLFIEVSEQEALDYLKGLTIFNEGSSGYRILSYKGLALGWVKHVNNTLKNHYPKGLRRKF